MYSKILERFEEIIRFTSEDITRDLKATLNNTANMTETSVFDDMLARQYKLRAYIFVVTYFRNTLKANCAEDETSLADSINRTHVQVFDLVTSEIITQSANIKLSVHYKMALLDMFHALQFAVPKK